MFKQVSHSCVSSRHRHLLQGYQVSTQRPARAKRRLSAELQNVQVILSSETLNVETNDLKKTTENLINSQTFWITWNKAFIFLFIYLFIYLLTTDTVAQRQFNNSTEKVETKLESFLATNQAHLQMCWTDEGTVFVALFTCFLVVLPVADNALFSLLLSTGIAGSLRRCGM